jgi:DNA end-binding protein Ku
MPRPIWKGSINFGLISIPVKLYSAISEKSVRFHQLDGRDGARIRQRRVNELTGEEVEYGDIVKGYEISPDHYVVVTEEELAQFTSEATHSLALDCFVDLDEIDPIFFDGAYHVTPSQPAKPYALLVQAMEASNKVGIARFVMRSKERVAVLRPKDGTLLLSMMVYADELNERESLPEFDDLAGVEVTQKELAMAESLIESLSEPFEPETYHDTYREQVVDLIEQKASGAPMAAPTAAKAATADVVDLMAALEASVRAAKQSRGRHPTSHESDDEGSATAAGDETEAAAAADKPKARSAPRKRKSA